MGNRLGAAMDWATRSAGITVLLLLTVVPASHPVTAQPAAAEAELFVEDAQGDVRVSSSPIQSPVNLPSQPATDGHDLLSLRVYDEDPEGLLVELRVVDLKAALGWIQSGTFEMGQFLVDFRLLPADTSYQLRWEIREPLPTDEIPRGNQPAWAGFCTRDAAGSCAAQHVVAWVNLEDSLFGAHVTKAALLGLDPFTQDGSRAVPGRALAARELTDFVVTVNPGPPGLTADRLPNEGSAGPFPLRHGILGSGLKVSLDPPANGTINVLPETSTVRADFPTVAVPVGVQVPARIRIYNDLAEPRRVNLSYRFRGEGPGPEWSPRLVEGVELPAAGSRVVNLILGPSRIPMGDSQLFQIVATHPSAPDVPPAAFTVRLVSAAPPPSPQHRELHFHDAGPRDTLDEAFIEVCRLPICQFSGWLNTEATDPRGTADEGTMMGQGLCRCSNVPEFRSESLGVFALDLPLPRDLVLDPFQAMELRLEISSPLPVSGDLAVLLYAGKDAIADGGGRFREGMTVTSLTYRGSTDRIRAGSVVTLEVHWQFDASSPSLIVNAASPLLFIPQGSLLTIPFIEDPLGSEETIPAGPAAIGLTVEGENERFANPGESVLFNLTLVNEGILEDVLALNGTQSSPEWEVWMEPGTDFRLQPGDAVVVALYARAPTTAVDGDSVRLLVNATSAADDTARSSLTFVVVATDGVDLADEAGAYVADDVVQRRVERSVSRTPNPGWAAILAGLVVAVGLSRKIRPQ